MDVRLPLFIASGLLLFACGSDPVPTTKEEENKEPLTIDEAKNIFILHCESCHGIDGRKKASDAADLSISKLSDAAVRQMILKGNDKGMMPYEDVITSERERNGLVEFVKTLRTEK